MGTQRALVALVREQVLAGVRGQALSDAARAAGERALDALERGLSDYAVRPS